MITDNQVRILMRNLQKEKTQALAAAKSGMDAKTARKYARLNKLPSEVKCEHNWRTRTDPFVEVWPEVREHLETNPGLEAKTIFEYLQRCHPGKFSDGQLRTLQRRIKTWRALEGPPKEVYFPQVYRPGELCQSDFTWMNQIGITICGQRFNHLLYHFVLPYSNWETGTICFSESFESLSEGFQNALWQLGGVPARHRTDQLSAAVQSPARANKDEFTRRYSALMRHYGIAASKIQAGSPHENGDVEQSHHRLKKALEQALLLRGSCDFNCRSDYAQFLEKLFSDLNAGRQTRFEEEVRELRRLPEKRFDSCKRFSVKVGPSSSIRVSHNVYSVNSRLIGETIQVRLYAEFFEIWYAQKLVERIERLRGSGKHKIEYRHIIDWLVRKPGAFENYRYRKDLFPTHRFRIAYDDLKQICFHRSSKEYLKILHLAAKENELAVEQALSDLLHQNIAISYEAVLQFFSRSGSVSEKSSQDFLAARDVQIDAIDIGIYDSLLSERLVA